LTLFVTELAVERSAFPPFHAGQASLTTDGTLTELHLFASRIGALSEWYRALPAPHYLLTAPRLAMAIAHGAKPAGGVKPRSR